jgi:DNA-binding NarL/FixJ family response regulator
MKAAVADEIRILIADDHPIVRKGMLFTLEKEPGLRVIAEAADGEAALALITEHLPNIAVLDINMPKLDGFGVAREISKRRLPVNFIFLTLHPDEELLRAAMDLGAKGYILKDSALEEIVAGVKAVAEGRIYLSSALTARLLQTREPVTAVAPSSDLVTGLTATERKIVSLIAEDKSSKEIGAELSIQYRTIENHRTNICRKLGIEGPNALLRFALQNKHKL